MAILSQASRSAAESGALLAECVDEITNRLQAGEQVNLDEYCRRYPEYAERLRSLLPALEVLADWRDLSDDAALGSGSDADSAASAGGGPAALGVVRGRPAVLGDFRLIRQIG